MSTSLRIGFDWLERDCHDPIERAAFAALTIEVADRSLTELEDLQAQTVRSSVRVCAHHLAYWFAENWWRLRWEAGDAEAARSEWQMSHRLAAIGGGYAWPDIALTSDGDHVLVQVRPSGGGAIDPVRFLASGEYYLTAEAFEYGIDAFVDAVLERLESLAPSSDLADLWQTVRAERRDPKRCVERKREAILGFDPGEAPADLITLFDRVAPELGEAATNELAAAGRGNFRAYIEAINGPVREHAQLARVPEATRVREKLRDRLDKSWLPWQQAADAARVVREVWGLTPGRLPNAELAGLLEIDIDLLQAPSHCRPQFAAGFRSGREDPDSIAVFLDKHWPTGRRFSLARLVGDHLYGQAGDRVLPATNTATARQKFQRAFAQELLCPFDALQSTMDNPDHPGEDDIEAAAAWFDVSPLLVRTTLVNRGVLERETLNG